MDVQYIVMMIQTIIFFLPIATLIWKFSKMHSQIEINKKAIELAVESNKEAIKRAHTRIDEHSDKTNSLIEEIRAQISSFAQSQARMEEKLNFLIKQQSKEIN